MVPLIVFELLMFDGQRLMKISVPDADSVLNTFMFSTFVFYQVSVVIVVFSKNMEHFQQL